MTPQEQIVRDVVPWLGEFCLAHGFVRKGRTNIARALNLLTGHQPRTRAETAFLAALWAEVERRRIVIPMTDCPPLGRPVQ